MKNKDLADFDRILAHHLRRMADSLEDGTGNLVDASLNRYLTDGVFELEITASCTISRAESEEIGAIVDRIEAQEDSDSKHFHEASESLRRLYYEVEAVEGED